MAKRRVVYLPSAERDLVSEFDYIARDRPAAALDWLGSIDRALGRLARFPGSGVAPKDQRLVALGYRMVVIGEHLAFYVVTPDRVEIRRVLHGKRRYGFLL